MRWQQFPAAFAVHVAEVWLALLPAMLLYSVLYSNPQWWMALVDWWAPWSDALLFAGAFM